MQTVAVLVVNKSILCGRARSKSCEHTVNQLNSLNYIVEKVTIVDESEKVVTNELRELSKLCDIVIVLGDDSSTVLRNAFVNICFGKQLTNTDLEQHIEEYSKFNSICLPPVKILTTSNDPTIRAVYYQRIYLINENKVEELFSGILGEHLRQYRLKPKFTRNINVQMNGNREILSQIERIGIMQLEYEDSRTNKVTIFLESENFEEIVEAERIVRKELGSNVIGASEKNMNLSSIYKSKEDHILQSVESIKKCLSTYGPENVFLSFNGGKDCTVLLHLLHVVMSVEYPTYRSPFFCLYVRSKDAFPEQDKFISQCQIYYNLDVMTVQLGIKDALNEVLRSKPNYRACLMGTRKADPYSSELQTFQITDHDWPQIMRVSPVLKWHYSDIWDYLLYYKVPYCSLYDMGFTSLGNASNTIRNPCLLYHDPKLGQEVYLPAYKMLNGAEERSGRNILK